MTRRTRVAVLLAALLVLWVLIASAVAAGYLAGVAIASTSRPAQLADPLLPGGKTTDAPVPSPDVAGQGEGPTGSPGPSATASPAGLRTEPSVRSLLALDREVEPETATTPAAAEVPTAAAGTKTISGVASTYGPGWDGWLALPEGPGVRVRICGTAACIVRTSTDAGPSLAMQRAGRIVDLDVPDFEAVCGCSWRTGLIRVTVEYLR